jgi:DNA-binding IclR family transcriptional regulator
MAINFLGHRFAAMLKHRENPTTRNAKVSTIIKALDILDLFSPAQPALGLSEAARILGRDKASVLRHFSALEKKGMVEQDTVTKHYHLGPALSRLAMVREQTAPANHSIVNVVRQLAKSSGETTHLSRYSNGRLVQGKVIDAPSRSGIRVQVNPAEELPLHATASGIAFLSVCTRGTREQVLAKPLNNYTASTPTTREIVLEHVEVARQQGFAIALGTYESGAIGIAAAVFNATGDACGAISVASPESRMDTARQQQIVTLVLEAARQISWHQGAPHDVISLLDSRMTAE